MTTPTIRVSDASLQARRPGRSAVALLSGFVAGVALSLGTDQIFHALDVYPPWGQPMYDTGLLLLALAYRIVYGVVASYIAAWLAPRAPMWHAMVLGVVALVVSAGGAVFAITKAMGPSWYPIVLALTTLPCAWIGGALAVARRQRTAGT